MDVGADFAFAQVKDSLVERCKAEGLARLGAGVSGGPDSMALLSLLLDVAAECGCKLFVLTVNHNIRESAGSAADADFVLDFCAKAKAAGADVLCEKRTIERGGVEACAAQRGRGAEEAARFLRYEFFGEFIARHGLDLFCLGHNQNDQLETLVQRFLQGASVFSAAGIAERRGVYFRPLLGVSRRQILEYAQSREIPYRIDATNGENVYARNKIRNRLAPLLDELFPGWQTGVLHGAEKAADAAGSLRALKGGVSWQPVPETLCQSRRAKAVQTDEAAFEKLPLALKIELLYDSLVELEYPARVRYGLLKAAALGGELALGGLRITRRGGKLRVESAEQDGGAWREAANRGFCLEVRGAGEHRLAALGISAASSPSEGAFGPFPLPCLVRSPQPADSAADSRGDPRALSRIFSDWKIPPEKRGDVVLVEAQNEILAVIADFMGKSWIVRRVPQQQPCVYLRFCRQEGLYERNES